MTSLIPQDGNFNSNSVNYYKDETNTNKDLLYKNGIYAFSSSSILNAENDAFKAFDNNPESFWQCNNSSNRTTDVKYVHDSYNGYVPSSYIGGGTKDTYWSTIADNKRYLGEWIQVNLPFSTYLAEYRIFSNQFPRKFHLLGSNNGSNWELLDTQSIETDYSNSSAPIPFKVKTVLKFNCFRLIISQLFKGKSASIQQLELLGNRNLLVNLKSIEKFTDYSSYSTYSSFSPNTKLSSQYYSMEYKPFSKFDILDTKNITEQFTSIREPLEIPDMKIAINEYNDKSNIANNNYGNLTTGIYSYLREKDDLINTTMYDYSGNIMFLKKNKSTTKDGLESDTKEFAMQENNILILGSITVAILLLGSYVILRN